MAGTSAGHTGAKILDSRHISSDQLLSLQIVPYVHLKSARSATAAWKKYLFPPMYVQPVAIRSCASQNSYEWSQHKM